MTEPFALASYTADAALWLLSVLRSAVALCPTAERLRLLLASVYSHSLSPPSTPLLLSLLLSVCCARLWLLSLVLASLLLSCSRRSCSLALLPSCSLVSRSICRRRWWQACWSSCALRLGLQCVLRPSLPVYSTYSDGGGGRRAGLPGSCAPARARLPSRACVCWRCR